ncbi:uncharacterized protein LOC127768469 isoform X2 [Oryza glaberrima]|uniref:uncharacterized protein LOC127768469 isoform X2 n=1 Tax=Oryza glaberrima TaxID=4538 RepID=UPI00224C24FF|nr:uncharacterized protein LOC127768469 isoform X2 [Oryza glaberrima]
MTKTNPDPRVRDQAMRSRKSVFMIIHETNRDSETSRSCGSGFVFKTRGGRCLVLTCEHVVADFQTSTDRLFIRRFLNLDSEQIEELPATLLYAESSRDIAILQVEGLSQHVPALRFSPMAIAPIGGTAIALGYCNPERLFSCLAFADFPAVSPGQVRSKIDRGPRGSVLRVDCVGMPGMSGGPIICRSGVTAVITSGNRGITNAISTETVHGVMKRWLRLGRHEVRNIHQVIRL